MHAFGISQDFSNSSSCTKIEYFTKVSESKYGVDTQYNTLGKRPTVFILPAACAYE